MSIFVPKKQKLDEHEIINLPIIKCSKCNELITKGIHRIRFIPVKKGYFDKKLKKYRPVTMRREDIYICDKCLKKNN